MEELDQLKTDQDHDQAQHDKSEGTWSNYKFGMPSNPFGSSKLDTGARRIIVEG